MCSTSVDTQFSSYASLRSAHHESIKNVASPCAIIFKCYLTKVPSLGNNFMTAVLKSQRHLSN